MKKILYFSFAALLFLGSCTGLLEEEPVDLYAAETFFDSDQKLIMESNGCYKVLTEQSYYGYTFRLAPELYADCYSGAADGLKELQGFAHGMISTDHQRVKAMWTTIYSAIGRTNMAIKRINNSVNTSEQIKLRTTAEVRFLRALHYFNLVRSWGEVPLRKDAVSDYNTQVDIPLSTRKEIYDFIITDLEFAREHCWNYNEKRGDFTNTIGHATSLAATTLLAKVYLQIASSVRVAYTPDFNDNGVQGINAGFKKGYVQSDATKYYELCRDLCQEGLGSADFFMEPVYADLWKINNRFSKEFLFSTQYTADEGYYGSLPNHYLPQNSRLGTAIESQAPVLKCKAHYFAYFDQPSGNVMINYPGAIDTEDVRIKEGFMGEYQKRTENENQIWKFQYFLADGTTLDMKYRRFDNGVMSAAAGDQSVYIKKFQDPASPNRNSSVTGYPIVRSVDLYLMLGESLAEIAQSPGAGYQAFTDGNIRCNTVSRMVLDDQLIAKFPGNSDMERFREYVMRERMMEFCGESDRFYTLTRMGRYLDKCDAIDQVGTRLGGKAGEKLRKWYHYVWPISQDEINGNNLINEITAGY